SPLPLHAGAGIASPRPDRRQRLGGVLAGLRAGEAVPGVLSLLFGGGSGRPAEHLDRVRPRPELGGRHTRGLARLLAADNRHGGAAEASPIAATVPDCRG